MKLFCSFGVSEGKNFATASFRSSTEMKYYFLKLTSLSRRECSSMS